VSSGCYHGSRSGCLSLFSFDLVSVDCMDGDGFRYGGGWFSTDYRLYTPLDIVDYHLGFNQFSYHSLSKTSATICHFQFRWLQCPKAHDYYRRLLQPVNLFKYLDGWQNAIPKNVASNNHNKI